MIVRPAKDVDLPMIQEIIRRCDLAVEGVDYTDWTGILLVAVRGGEVIGFLWASPGKPYATIHEVGVLPEHQRGRAGTKLIESAELLLRSLGSRCWAGYVGSKRDAAHAGLPGLEATKVGDGTMYYRSLT